MTDTAPPADPPQPAMAVSEPPSTESKTSDAQEISPTVDDYKKNPPPPTTIEGYVKDAQDFVKGTLQRTGTLYSSAKDAVIKRSGSLYEGAKEGVSEGLKRSGTMYETAKEGVNQGLKRSGTIYEGAKEGVLRRSSTFGHTGGMIQRTGSFFQETGQVMVKRTGSWFEDTNAYIRGYFDPNKPLHAIIREINGVTLPRVGATISVIDGRAYIFGGEDERGNLADNIMHIVILPGSATFEADYTTALPKPQVAGEPVPSARKCHSAVVIGQDIYMFGGQLAPKAAEEAGRVWVFSSKTRRWSHHDPSADAPYPPPRHSHAATATDPTGPTSSPEGTADAPEQDVDAGTLFIAGGVSTASDAPPDAHLPDAWAFDVASGTWMVLPPPPTGSHSASLALAQGHLVRVGSAGAQLRVDSLDVSELLAARRGGALGAASLPSLLSEWASTVFPDAALGAARAAVNLASPGGRAFLLVFAGAAASPPEHAPAGVVAVELTVGALTRAEDPEAEDRPLVKRLLSVEAAFVDPYGEALEESAVAKERLERRTAFLSSPGSEVDGSHLIVWGGKNANGEVVGDGYMLTVEF